VPTVIQNELILKQLTAGEEEPVLVADFQAFSTAPRLSRMLSGRVGGRPVYQVDPVTVLAQDQLYLPLSALAAACVDAFTSGTPPGGRVFVVGHCSAAALALHIARLLEGSREVTVLLVLPTWPDDDHVRTRFTEFLANIGAATNSCPDLDSDASGCVAAMETILRAELAAVAAGRGLGTAADAFADLLAWYRAWLSFLLACRNDLPLARATTTAAVRVLSDAVIPAGIPGLRETAYQVRRLPFAGQASRVTTQLAEFVAAQLGIR
jgi:hypothetical protein